MKMFGAVAGSLLGVLCTAAPCTAFDNNYPMECANDPKSVTPNFSFPGYMGQPTWVSPIPKGASPQVWYWRPRGEASWISVCLSTGDKKWKDVKQTGTTQDKIPAILLHDFGPLAETAEITHFSVRIRLTNPFTIYDPWDGVVVTDELKDGKKWGTSFAWYDSAGPANPNTIVYVCPEASFCFAKK